MEPASGIKAVLQQCYINMMPPEAATYDVFTCHVRDTVLEPAILNPQRVRAGYSAVYENCNDPTRRA